MTIEQNLSLLESLPNKSRQVFAFKAAQANPDLCRPLSTIANYSIMVITSVSACAYPPEHLVVNACCGIKTKKDVWMCRANKGKHCPISQKVKHLDELLPPCGIQINDCDIHTDHRPLTTHQPEGGTGQWMLP